MEEFKWIWQYLREYKFRLFFGLFIVIVMAALAMVGPYITKVIVDDVITGGNTGLLPVLIAVLIGAVLVRTTSRYFFMVSFEHLSQNVIHNIRKDIYENIQAYDFEFFDRTRTGDIMARMTGDIEAVRHFTAMIIYASFEAIVTLVFAVTVLFTINIPLALLMLAIAPASLYFVKKFSAKVKPSFSAIREQFSRLNTVVQENISGNRVVKAFTNEEHEIDKFNEENESFRQKSMKAARIFAEYIPVLDSIAGFLTVVMIIAGGAMVIGGSLTLGGLVAFSGYIWALNNPMRMAGWIINDIQRFAASGEKIRRLLEEEPQIKSKPGGIADAERAVSDSGADGSADSENSVEFRDVCFSYGGEPILKNINLKVKGGETVAFVGPTGSGKTSLINMIGRFYDCTSGEVLVGGRNVKDIDIAELRPKIGIAMQDVFLFSDTIEGNIGYAVPESGIEDIQRVARMACADDFINYLSEKYDTIIGERGMGLSGGQKQRLSLARAFLTEPPILILDDTTSSLDFETEFRIQTILRSMYNDRTTLIISHRISSVCNADMIYVMDKGRIVESGSHAELLAHDGYYHKVYNSQVGEFIEDLDAAANGYQRKMAGI